MIRTLGKWAVAFGVLALAGSGSTALAQGGRGFGGGMGGGAMLLSNKGVQKELKLSEEQIGKADAFTKEQGEKMREKFQGLQDLDQGERREKMQAIMKESTETTNKFLKDTLSADQAKRFQQISLQQRGYTAFTDTEIQSKLKFSDEQKDKVKQINEDAMKAMQDARQEAGNDFQAMREKMTELRKETMSKVNGVLTDDQKKTWKEMTGEPFEVKFEAPRRPA